uniref:Uncharacterized protein n=1 Tax=Pseudictyota dubia TaxID=2749911 RepID=A0A7R9W172_9STRA|mmetsp:Transcript_27458/g.50996  ORF Transcript_27458/g.50996 Transcript_27458/m.50996 type:complete len:173 (+) Transcript_27458:161-679(+)
MTTLRRVLALVVAALSANSAAAFSTGFAPGAASRTFRCAAVSAPRPRRGTAMEMRAVGKRGKSAVPPRLRHDYSHRVQERDLKSDSFAPHLTGDDGVPAINLFVRGHRTHSWLPCGSFLCDGEIVSLVDDYRDTDSPNAKDEIDEVVARSLSGVSHKEKPNFFVRVQGDLYV